MFFESFSRVFANTNVITIDTCSMNDVGIIYDRWFSKNKKALQNLQGFN